MLYLFVKSWLSNTKLEDEKGLYLWESKLKGWFREDNITPNNFLGMIEDGNEHTPIKGSSPFNWGCGSNFVFSLNEEGLFFAQISGGEFGKNRISGS